MTQDIYRINIHVQLESIYKMNDEKKRNDRCMKDIEMIILETKSFNGS